MNLFDMFEGREPYQQAIDKLEARRIEDLEAKMDDLHARSRKALDDGNAELFDALRQEFMKAKAERDSYHTVNEAPGAETLAHNQSTDANNLKALGMAENFISDTNYTYTVFIDGTKEGTYGSQEEARAVVRRKKEVAPGRDYRIKPKARTSAASIKRFQKNRDRNLDESTGKLTVSPHDAGMHAALKGKPYESNPYPKGSKEHLEWSKGHNAMRARKAQDLDEHGGGGGGPAQWHAYVRSHRTNEDELDEHGGGVNGMKDYISWRKKANTERGVTKAPPPVGKSAPSKLPTIPKGTVHGKLDQSRGVVPKAAFEDQDDLIKVEGWQDFNKVEPYEVCLAGKPIKTFDYYEDARRFHDNWKKKLYNQGEKEKADKITLNPIMKEGDIGKAVGGAIGSAIGRTAGGAAGLAGGPIGVAGGSIAGAAAGGMAGKELGDKVGDKLDTIAQNADRDTTLGGPMGDTPISTQEASTVGQGSWIVYDPETKQIKKRFKTHTAGKSYAKVHNLGFASSEFYFDQVKDQVDEQGWSINPEHLKGPRSMKSAANKPTGPKFSGYLKGTDPAPNEYTNKGVGGCEESADENPMGEKELAYLIAKAKGLHNEPDPELHKGDEHEIGFGQKVGEGIAGNMTARSNPLSQPLRARNFVAKNAIQSGAGKHANQLKKAAAAGRHAKHKGQLELDEMTDDEVAKIRKDAEDYATKQMTKPKQAEPKKSFMQQVGDKQIGMVKGAWKGLTGQLEESDNFLTWAVRNGFEITKPAIYESAKKAFAEAKIKKGQKDSNGNTSCWDGYHADGTKPGKNGGQVRNCVKNENVEEDWQKANKKDKTDGMSQKAVNAYKKEHPGSKLKTAVTTKPSKLKKGSKDSKRRSSYCARSKGQKDMHNIDCTKTPDKAICKARKRWNCEGVENLDAMLAEAIVEATKIGNRVKIVTGAEAGQTGTIGEIRPGAFKGAPGYYTVDLDNGSHIQVRKEALRLIKNEVTESLRQGEYYVWTVYFDDGTSKRIKVTSDEFDPYEYYAKQNKVVVNVDYNWAINN